MYRDFPPGAKKMFDKISHRLSVAACLVVTAVSCSRIDDPSLFPAFNEVSVGEPPSLRSTGFNSQPNLYFGDLHVHTGLSTDAFVMGVRSRPEDVYRFARGHAIEHAAGYPIRIARPLDFVAVTDHSEYLGQAWSENVDAPTNRRALRDLLLNGNALSITWAWFRTTLLMRQRGFGWDMSGPDPVVNQSAWRETIEAAEKYNQPGVFTSFIGYEWSAYVGDVGTHIHRNVIYRGSDVADKPFTSLDSNRPEDLWNFLRQEERQGRVAMAIPHNANVSKGNMYAPVTSEGIPIDKDYAETRAYYEPLNEILQIKGASETHPLLSSLDEFAALGIARIEPHLEDSLESVKGSYARDALRLGIELSHKEGFNPFKFGFIGSTDSHNASSPTEESDYSGKLPMMDGSAGLRTSAAMLLPMKYNPVSSWSSGGLAGVWSQENTRGAIFDALRRKETFATSGPRISLRMFAGWDLTAALLDRPDLMEQAYLRGVPMGGQLRRRADDASPGFLIMALKDEQGANLDRVQVIKGWVDADGRSHEKVFDVLASGGREIDQQTGSFPPVGNTVDLGAASYENTIGTASLLAYWEDPEFDPALEAFYYSRVLEIPTPRWSTYDAVKLGIEPMEPATIQERAIGSPIWYSPIRY
jgi:hypothetical protein